MFSPHKNNAVMLLKNKLKIIFFFFCSLLQLNCQSQERITNFSEIDTVYNKQEFKIIPVYNHLNNYINEVKKEPDNASKLYHDIIYNPIKNKYIKNAEFAEIFETIKQTSTDYSSAKKIIDSLKRSKVVPIILSGLKRINNKLSGPATTIVLLPMNPDLKELYKKYNLEFMYTGVTAITPGSGVIIISIDPFESNWESILDFVLAHEYHHSVWMSRNFKRKDLSLIEYIIFEGRADVFAESLYPTVNVPWNSNLSKEKEIMVWEIIKDKVDSRDSDFNDRIMVGNKDIPYSSGYCIGYNIVKKFIELHPNITTIGLIDMEPNIILEKSNYENYIYDQE